MELYQGEDWYERTCSLMQALAAMGHIPIHAATEFGGMLHVARLALPIPGVIGAIRGSLERLADVEQYDMKIYMGRTLELFDLHISTAQIAVEILNAVMKGEG
jgi:hypothetical protein